MDNIKVYHNSLPHFALCGEFEVVGRDCGVNLQCCCCCYYERQNDITSKLACWFDFHHLLSISEILKRKMENETLRVRQQ